MLINYNKITMSVMFTLRILSAVLLSETTGCYISSRPSGMSKGHTIISEMIGPTHIELRRWP